MVPQPGHIVVQARLVVLQGPHGVAPLRHDGLGPLPRASPSGGCPIHRDGATLQRQGFQPRGQGRDLVFMVPPRDLLQPEAVGHGPRLHPVHRQMTLGAVVSTARRSVWLSMAMRAGSEAGCTAGSSKEKTRRQGSVGSPPGRDATGQVQKRAQPSLPVVRITRHACPVLGPAGAECTDQDVPQTVFATVGPRGTPSRAHGGPRDLRRGCGVGERRGHPRQRSRPGQVEHTLA